MRAIWILVMMVCRFSTEAQEITGNVVDGKKEPVMQGVVYVTQGGRVRGTCTLDYDGNYQIKPLDPGCYDAVVVSTGYDTILMNDVIVDPDRRTILNFNVGQPKPMHATIVRTYRKPLVMSEPGQSVLQADVEKKPVPEYIETSGIPGVYTGVRGNSVSIGGCYANGTVYVIDAITYSVQVIDCPTDTVDDLLFNPNDHVFNRKGLDHMPYMDLRDVAATLPGVYQARRGDELHVYGSR